MNKKISGKISGWLILAALLPVSAMAQQAGRTNTVAALNAMPTLPPNAQPGECYARTFLPPVFRTVACTVALPVPSLPAASALTWSAGRSGR